MTEVCRAAVLFGGREEGQIPDTRSTCAIRFGIESLYRDKQEVHMPSATVQVLVLMSPAQKRRLARKAKAANLTMGELLRRGAERFSADDDPTMLDQFAAQVTESTRRAIQSIDKTLALVAQSEARIQALVKRRGKR